MLVNQFNEGGLNGEVEEELSSVEQEFLDSFNNNINLGYLAIVEKPRPCKNTSIAPNGDPVNSPGHYNQGGVECIDALESALEGLSGVEAFCIVNAIIYLWRYKHKDNPLQDLEKAIWYIDRAKRYNKHEY